MTWPPRKWWTSQREVESRQADPKVKWMDDIFSNHFKDKLGGLVYTHDVYNLYMDACPFFDCLKTYVFDLGVSQSGAIPVKVCESSSSFQIL